MLLDDVVRASAEVAAVSSRKAKSGRLAALLAALSPDEVGPVVAWLSGEPAQGRIGIGPAALRRLLPVPAAASPSWTVDEVDRALGALAGIAGSGATEARGRALHELFSRATGGEQDFLLRLLTGELRQGALEGVLVDAVSAAARVPAEAVRRAAMLHGRLPEVARTALDRGLPGLQAYRLALFRPVSPMLAASAGDVAAALSDLGDTLLEFKLDGARVQLHKRDDEVRVFTRRLNEVTDAVPELVEAARALPARELVLDGEVLALRKDGTPRPFQATMRRFGRRLDVVRMRTELPLTPFYFDVLHLDGETLLDRPARERLEALSSVLPGTARIPQRTVRTAGAAADFLEQALEAGHEGLMAKSLEAPYEAGRRGGSWLKVKPAHTLDLVVLAAEWGHGRRRGLLSNLHLGARSAAGFVMLGKTFKGLTDEMLQWQTRRLLELELARDAWTVYVRPELVVEIAFEGVQDSPQYPGGVALRFARVKRYRSDKQAGQADTLETIIRMRRR